MFRLLPVLFFFFLSFAVFAQTPSLRIIRVNADKYCLGTELSIDVDVQGTFPAGNKFTVVAFRDWNNPARRWEYPAELRGDKLVTVLKEPSLANSQTFGIRVLTSSPQSEIETYDSYKALTKASVKLTTRWGGEADTLNSTDKIALSLIANPSTPGKVTLNSGDSFDLIYASDWTTPYATVITLPKTKAGSYSIAEASNLCGPMTASGKVDIKVNSIDFMPVAVSPQEPCAGGQVKVVFSTDGGAFNANTKFRIRFASDNYYLDSYKYLDAPATLTGKNELTARVPEGITQTMSNQGIYIAIVTDNPSTVSVTKALKLYVHDRPSFTLKTEKSSISLGESTSISASPTGRPPYKITLNTGEVMDFWLSVSPKETTSYQVKTFESGCGVIENPPNTPLTVTVKPSLLLTGTTRTSRPGIFCEGQTVRIGFRANGVTPQTTYSVVADTYSGKKISFPAKVVGDSLEFMVAKNTNPDTDVDYSAIGGVQAVSANPALTSPYIGMKIQSPPTMVIAANSSSGVAYPSAVRLDFDLWGGAPYDVELANGSKYTYDYRNVWFEQFVKRDTVFKLAKLSNACFTNSNPPSFPIKVVNPAGTTPSVFARLVKKNYCMGDSVEVELAFSGKFDAGNEFTLSSLRDGQVTTYAIRNLTKPGTYKVKLPEREGRYTASLELSSSLPRLTSETERFDFGIPPRIPTIRPEGSKERPAGLYLGEAPEAIIEGIENGGIVYSVGGVEGKATLDYNGRYRVPLQLQHGKTTEFKLKSVINECGAWEGEMASYFQGIGYKIVGSRDIYYNWRCAGTDAEARFSFESGKPGPGTKFTFQISASGAAGSYTDVASVVDAQVIRFVVPDLPAGSYYTRIASSDNIYSQPVNISIGQAPVVTLATNYPTPGANNAVVDYGTPVYLAASMTGNTPWGIMYSDGEQQQPTGNGTSYEPVVTGPQTFSITKVWNSCGYGTASGQVKVTVKPVLELSKFPADADPTICAGQKVQLDFGIKGIELPGNVYLVFSIADEKGKAVKLDSVNRTTGRIQLTIPSDIAGGQFNIKAEIASLQLSKSIFYQLYATPDMTLLGDNTITAGESTVLYIRSNSTFAANTNFQLSDGTSYTNNAPFPGGLMLVRVSPAVTTTYSIKPIQSACGAGRVSGSATITVQPRQAQWLAIQTVEGLNRSIVCASDTVRIHFYQFGSSGSTMQYDVQLSDSTGKNFVSIPTFGQYSPVTAILPAGTSPTGIYRLRLNAKDPKVSGSTYAEVFRIRQRARAKVLTPSVFYQPGQTVNVVIGLEGTPPFYYRFGDDNFYRFRNTTGYSDTIALAPVTPLATYKISALSNECGPGTIGDPSSLTIELITATEPVGEAITFGPNPTNDLLFVRFESAAPRNVEIINAAGQRIFEGRFAGKDATVDFSAFPSGTYLFRVTKKQTAATYRIVKY